MNLGNWDKTKWQLKGKSGPPGNMNAFKHGLAAIQKQLRNRVIITSSTDEFPYHS
jgi:hypothetical protein